MAIDYNLSQHSPPAVSITIIMKWITFLYSCSKIMEVSTFTPPIVDSHLSVRRFSSWKQPSPLLQVRKKVDSILGEDNCRDPFEHNDPCDMPTMESRRSLFSKAARSLLSIAVPSAAVTMSSLPSAQAEIGTLPDFKNTNFVMQGMTVNVAELSQFDDMVSFLQDGLGFSTLRTREIGTVTEAWLGFGPEEMAVPTDFTPGPSSFNMYGGHASLHLRYDSRSVEPFYKGNGEAPGNNIEYVQVGVPSYRISQMIKAKGNILDAFGLVNVVSPSGLPMRAIVGIRPDPIMFVAINTRDIEQSRAFYEQFGMVKQPFPYARPSNGTGQFEPPQPEGSVYLAQTPFSLGVLLLPVKDTLFKKVSVVPNKVVRSLNVVYNPTSSATSIESLNTLDPSQVGVALTPLDDFSKGLKMLPRE